MKFSQLRGRRAISSLSFKIFKVLNIVVAVDYTIYSFSIGVINSGPFY